MAEERLKELENEGKGKSSDEPPVKRALLKARDYTVSAVKSYVTSILVEITSSNFVRLFHLSYCNELGVVGCSVQVTKIV